MGYGAFGKRLVQMGKSGVTDLGCSKVQTYKTLELLSLHKTYSGNILSARQWMRINKQVDAVIFVAEDSLLLYVRHDCGPRLFLLAGLCRGAVIT